MSPLCHQVNKPQKQKTDHGDGVKEIAASSPAAKPKLNTLAQFENVKCYSSAVYTPQEHEALIQNQVIGDSRPDDTIRSADGKIQAPGGPSS